MANFIKQMLPIPSSFSGSFNLSPAPKQSRLSFAKVAMKELEAKTGKKVVTALNAKSILPEIKSIKKLAQKNKC